jgi:hypothetical protein
MAKPVIVFSADEHFGSNTALMPKEFVNDDKQLITASPIQLWLLENWNTAWKEVWQYCKRRTVIAVFVGDMVEGNHDKSVQGMTNMADQENMAFEMIEPIVHKANRTYILRGTARHTGEAAESESRIASRLGVPCLWEITSEWGNKIFNISHHGKAGGLPWTTGMSSVVAACLIDAVKLSEPSPNYIVRAHAHVVDDTGEKFPNCRGFTLPAWQLRTGFGFKVASHRVSDIGLAWIDLEKADQGHGITIRRFYAPRHFIREYND